MRNTRNGLMIAALVAGMGWPVQAGIMDKILPTKTKTQDGDADMGLPEYKGLKHAIGVVDFDNTVSGWHGQWPLERNMGIMMESALMDSGRFVVVDRQALNSTLKEQDLMASGRMAKGAKVAETGKLRAAKFMASGAITDIEDDTSGGNAGINIKGFRIGGSGGKATVTAIIRLVDTSSGAVVAKKRIVGEAGKKGLSVGYAGADWGGTLGGFNKTPLGEAAQDVINEAVKFLAEQMEEQGFDGSVVKVTSGDQVIINRGTDYGVEEGQVFVVATEGETLLDPDTGEVLDQEEGKVIGKIKVSKVKEKIAYCDLIDGEKPEAGAAVREK